MIVGVGLDVVEVDRMAQLLARRGPVALRRLFTETEVAHCRAAPHPAASFAARFAAKEALLKALGTGWSGGVRWVEVEVVAADAAAPRLVLSGRAAALAAQRGVARCHLSLTHTAQWAAALVVLEGA